MNKSTQRVIAFSFGVVFVVVLIVLAIEFPNPTPFQYEVFRIVLALAAAGVASMIPGFLSAQVSTIVRAGGALAVFVIVYFYSPVHLVKSEQQVEIDKPLVGIVLRSISPLLSAANAAEPIPDLKILSTGQLLQPGVLEHRYGTITVDGVVADVPVKSTLVANDILGLNRGGLRGSNFSIVARRMANISVEAIDPVSARGGSAHLYVKEVQNAKLIARGRAGAAGANGADGKRGLDGPDGRDGKCDGFGGYRGADGGGDGQNGEDGGNGLPGDDGQAGGLIALTTIATPIDTVVDVSGGDGGEGGRGGEGGAPGRGGKGGAGCTGLGGSQSNQSGGKSGLAGASGHNGSPGHPGSSGEYRLLVVKSFDGISQKLATLPNSRLHDALQLP